uniref:Ribonuclease Z n=1 Tax=Kapraunia schneideri TaxID=717899 RepID=A0A1Z1MRW3_9FLOR|nr:ribonuclease Z [Kapraunia schneideri]ARW68837.1 ribonuclease Z [Kapraunia schneideri]
MFRYLDFQNYIFRKKNASFLIKLPLVKDTWLLNCTEGTQFNFFNQDLKISNLSKIIIPDLHITNLSGLIGLLSTLNLIGRTKSLHIYAPSGLKYYLNLGKKYSRTNFSYIIYIHTLDTGLIINKSTFRVYSIRFHSFYKLLIIQAELYGTFCLQKAKNNNLVPGPIYSRLKKGFSFIMPDGFIINGYSLTQSNQLGFQISYSYSYFYRKNFFKLLQGNSFTLFF